MNGRGTGADRTLETEVLIIGGLAAGIDDHIPGQDAANKGRRKVPIQEPGQGDGQVEVAARRAWGWGDFVGMEGPEEHKATGGDVDGFSAEAIVKRFFRVVEFNFVVLLVIPHRQGMLVGSIKSDLHSPDIFDLLHLSWIPVGIILSSIRRQPILAVWTLVLKRILSKS